MKRDAHRTPHIFFKNNDGTDIECSTPIGKQVKGPHSIEFRFHDVEGDSACNYKNDDITKAYGSVIHEVLHAMGI